MAYCEGHGSPRIVEVGVEGGRAFARCTGTLPDGRAFHAGVRYRVPLTEPFTSRHRALVRGYAIGRFKRGYEAACERMAARS